MNGFPITSVAINSVSMLWDSQIGCTCHDNLYLAKCMYKRTTYVCTKFKYTPKHVDCVKCVCDVTGSE